MSAFVSEVLKLCGIVAIACLLAIVAALVLAGVDFLAPLSQRNANL